MKSTKCLIQNAKWVLLLQFLFSYAPAQTLTGGDILINSTWTLAGSPYHVMSDLRIAGGVALTVEPGVEVRFADGVRMDVEGNLVARGNTQDSVLFGSLSPAPDTGSWSGMQVHGSTAGRIDLQFVRIAHASVGLSSTGTLPFGSIVLGNTEFRSCATGISGLQGGILLRGCGFKENNIAVQASVLSFSQCAWAGNNVGISGGTVSVDSSTFTKHLGAAIADASGFVKSSLFISNTIGLLTFGVSPTDSVNGCQFAENDTAAVATGIGSSFFGNEFCANDIQVKVLGNAHVAMQGNCWCSVDTNQIVNGFVDGRSNAQLGWVMISPIDTNCQVISQVWPGDANDDGVATIADMLYLGVAYNKAGPQRANATASWTGQAGLPWNQSFDFGANYKHSDCDGNGLVTLADTLPIVQNLGEIHYKRSGVSTGDGIPVVFEFPLMASAGDIVPVTVKVGTQDNPAVGVYGISFVLSLDSSVFETTYGTNLTGSWLGTAGSDLIDLDLYNQGIHWAIVRNDQADRSGSGKMGGVTLVMIDDLTMPVQLDSAVEVSEALLIDKKGNAIEADVQMVFIHPCADNQLSVCPTVANQRIQVILDMLTAESVELYNLAGHLAYRQMGPVTGTLDIDARQLQPGMYIVKVNLADGVLNRKVFILR